MKNKLLFFDIETLADPEAVKFLPEPSAPANYKDPAKIAEYIANAKAEQLTKAALDPDTGTIAALGHYTAGIDEAAWCLMTGDEYLLGEQTRQATEADLLVQFWAMFDAANGATCGYNTIGFDLPYIMRRSFALGIKPPAVPKIQKYQTYPTLDLYGVLYNWQPGKGLKTVAKRYGLVGGLDDDTDGSMFGTLFHLDREKARRYCAADVDLTACLHDRMSGFYF